MDKMPAPEKSPFPAVDYDHLDAAALNEQIRKIAAGRTACAGIPAPSASPSEPPSPAPPPAPVPPPALPSGFKAKMKGRLRRLVVPFFPVLRLLALPVHEELGAVGLDVDHTAYDIVRRAVRIYALSDRSTATSNSVVSSTSAIRISSGITLRTLACSAFP